jgi:hypothetical protein
MQINQCTRRLDRLTLTRAERTPDQQRVAGPGGLGAGDNTDEAPRVLKTNCHFCEEDTGRLGARERRTIKNWYGKVCFISWTSLQI